MRAPTRTSESWSNTHLHITQAWIILVLVLYTYHSGCTGLGYKAWDKLCAATDTCKLTVRQFLKEAATDTREILWTIKRAILIRLRYI